MRNLKFFRLMFLLLVLALGGTIAVIIYVGPRAAPPTVDPLVQLNREHADTPDNAADLYAAAIDAFHEMPKELADATNDWKRGDPVPDDVKSWLVQNEPALELVRKAVRHKNCWSKLTRDGGIASNGLEHKCRSLARMVAWRARVAAEERDLDTFTELVVVPDEIGRHMGQTPLVIPSLMGIACMALTQEKFILDPLTWDGLTAESRSTYLKRVIPTFAAPASMLPVVEVEKELCGWEYESGAMSASVHFLAPPNRVCGELQRFFRPLISLADAPVSEQCNPDDPRRKEIAKLKQLDPRVNMPQKLAKILCPDLVRVYELRARVATLKHGNRTVLELFAYRDRTGAFPDSLAVFDGDFTTDPFTGAPLIYRKTAREFTLYSTAADRDDDGGKHDPNWGEDRTHPIPNPPDGDYVLWPIPPND